MNWERQAARLASQVTTHMDDVLANREAHDAHAA